MMVSRLGFLLRCVVFCPFHRCFCIRRIPLLRFEGDVFSSEGLLYFFCGVFHEIITSFLWRMFMLDCCVLLCK